MNDTKQDKYERLIERIRSWAKEEGFTDEEVAKATLDGFGKFTQSSRIMRLCKLAYYRGWMRGVKTVKEAETPIVLR